MATFTSGCLFVLNAYGRYVMPAINNDGNRTVANIIRFHKGNDIVWCSVRKITDAMQMRIALRI